MAVLVGLAMLATPLAAAAKDYHHYDSHAARVEARAVNASAHSFAATRNYDRAVRNDAAAYRAYGYRGYAAPGYVGAPYYGGGYGGGGYVGGNGCGSAQRVMNTYNRDRNTGHPAAAYDLLARNRWAFNSGCAGAAPVGGGLFGGGVPAYSNYGGNGLGGLFGGSPAAYSNYRPAYNGGGYNGGGYGQPYRSNGLLGGLFGGSPAANTNYRPAYNGAGYNGGYGQPNGGGSGLGSLMQYIR